jgi:CRISPR/Cas system CSM-associated protein Csm4 (group 5 of RAMP superfamily)
LLGRQSVKINQHFLGDPKRWAHDNIKITERFKMNKWEYKTVKVNAKGWFLGGILDENEFDSLLNSMGQEGWELV